MKTERIAILGIKGGTTTALGSLVTALNCGRLDPQVSIEQISPPLADQCRRVMVEGKWPLATPAGSDEFAIFQRRQRQFRAATVSGPDIRLHRGAIRELQGDALTILVLDPTQDADVARRSVPARAFWMQEHLGLAAGEAILESLQQHFALRPEELARTHPKFMGRVAKLNQPQVRWMHDAGRDGFAERYPLDGVNGRDLKQFWRDLEDIVLSACRRASYELHLLGAVVVGAEKLIVTFNRVEWLPTLPGVHFDYLALAHKIVAPRPGIVYVAEKYVDYRLASDGESIEQLEGFSEAGAELLWEATTTLLEQEAARQPEAPREVAPLLRAPRWMAITAAVMLCLAFMLSVVFGGWLTLLAAMGGTALVALELALIAAIWTQDESSSLPSTAEATPASPATDDGAHASLEAATPPATQVPAAIARRSALPSHQNGKHLSPN